MEKLAVILLIVLGLAVSASAKADDVKLLSGDNALGSFAEHFAASAAIYTVVYEAMHRGLGASKTQSFIFGAFTSALIGFVYKDMEWMEEGYQPHNFNRSMFYNGVGIAVPAMVLWKFDL